MLRPCACMCCRRLPCAACVLARGAAAHTWNWEPHVLWSRGMPLPPRINAATLLHCFWRGSHNAPSRQCAMAPKTPARPKKAAHATATGTVLKKPASRSGRSIWGVLNVVRHSGRRAGIAVGIQTLDSRAPATTATTQTAPAPSVSTHTGSANTANAAVQTAPSTPPRRPLIVRSPPWRPLIVPRSWC